MKSTWAAYVLTVVTVAAYGMFYVDWYARFARKWLLPSSSLLLVVLIPVTWFLFARRKRILSRPISVWPQLGLIPVWLHSLFIALWVLGWTSTGGL